MSILPDGSFSMFVAAADMSEVPEKFCRIDNDPARLPDGQARTFPIIPLLPTVTIEKFDESWEQLVKFSDVGEAYAKRAEEIICGTLADLSVNVPCARKRVDDRTLLHIDPKLMPSMLDNFLEQAPVCRIAVLQWVLRYHRSAIKLVLYLNNPWLIEACFFLLQVSSAELYALLVRKNCRLIRRIIERRLIRTIYTLTNYLSLTIAEVVALIAGILTGSNGQWVNQTDPELLGLLRSGCLRIPYKSKYGSRFPVEPWTSAVAYPDSYFRSATLANGAKCILEQTLPDDSDTSSGRGVSTEELWAADSGEFFTATRYAFSLLLHGLCRNIIAYNIANPTKRVLLLIHNGWFNYVTVAIGPYLLSESNLCCAGAPFICTRLLEFCTNHGDTNTDYPIHPM